MATPDPSRRPLPPPSSLRLKRRARGWTLADVSSQVGISAGWLSLAERGIVQLSPEVVRRLDHLLRDPTAPDPDPGLEFTISCACGRTCVIRGVADVR